VELNELIIFGKAFSGGRKKLWKRTRDTILSTSQRVSSKKIKKSLNTPWAISIEEKKVS